MITFDYENEDDNLAIDLCFNRKKADLRKDWLANYDPAVFVDHNLDNIRFHTFVHNEFIHYSNADNIR